MWDPRTNWQPQSSYQQPVRIPAAGPADPPVVCVQVNQLWIPYVAGALMQLVQPLTWDTSDPAALSAVQIAATELIETFGIASPCPAVDQPGGLVWIINYASGFISQFATDGSPRTPNPLGPDLVTATGAVFIDGVVWIGCDGPGSVVLMNLNGHEIMPPWTANEPGNTYGMALVPLGSTQLVWLCDRFADSIVLLQTNNQTDNVLSGNGLAEPVDVCLWQEAVDVVSVNHGHGGTGDWSLSLWTAFGTSAGPPVTDASFNFPFGCGTSPDGKLWIANAGNSSISTFNTDLTLHSILSGNGLNAPHSIRNVAGQMWIANAGGNSVSRFHPDGSAAGVPLTGNGLNEPQGVCWVV